MGISKFTSYLLLLVQEIFGTNVGSAFLLYIIVLFCNAFLISLVLDHYLGTSSAFTGIVTAVSSYSFLIGMAYNNWMAKVNASRGSALRRYVRMVETGKSTLTYLTGLYKAAIEEDNNQIMNEEDLKRFASIRDSILMISWTSYKLFYPQDNYLLSFDDKEHVKDDIYYSLHDANDETIAVYNNFYNNPVRLTDRLMVIFMQNIAILQKKDYVNDVLIDQTISNFRDVMTSIVDIAVEGTMTEPKFYSALNGVMALFWVFIWMPINLWFPLGTFWTVIFYPILGVILTGSALFDAIRGNTFDPHTKIVLGEPHINRMMILDTANEMFK